MGDRTSGMIVEEEDRRDHRVRTAGHAVDLAVVVDAAAATVCRAGAQIGLLSNASESRNHHAAVEVGLDVDAEMRA